MAKGKFPEFYSHTGIPNEDISSIFSRYQATAPVISPSVEKDFSQIQNETQVFAPISPAPILLDTEANKKLVGVLWNTVFSVGGRLAHRDISLTVDESENLTTATMPVLSKYSVNNFRYKEEFVLLATFAGIYFVKITAPQGETVSEKEKIEISEIEIQRAKSIISKLMPGMEISDQNIIELIEKTRKTPYNLDFIEKMINENPELAKRTAASIAADLMGKS